MSEHSFIFQPESNWTLRQLVLTAVAVVVILVVSDWLLGRLIRYITAEPPFLLRLENMPGVEALWRFSEAGIKPIVFTGSSQTYSGISPHVFDTRIKAISGQDVKSVDVTFLGSVATIERDLIRNLIIPNHPQVVVYAIEMRALNPESQDERNEAVSDFRNESLGYALSQDSAAFRDFLIWLLKHSNWIRYRDNFHQWFTGQRGINQEHFFQITIDDVGYSPGMSRFMPDPNVIKTQFIPFGRSETVQKALGDIAANCQQTGTTCVLLNMPIHPMAYEYIKPEEETLYKDVLKEAGLPVWDFNTSSCHLVFKDELFLDLNHLNSKGADKFSAMIADVYANRFLNTPLLKDQICGEYEN